MALIFDEANFNKVITDRATRETAARAADEKINKEGKVLYGIITETGKAVNFTTQQKEQDTHKLIGIGIKGLALFAEADAHDPVQQELTSHEDELRALRERVRIQEGELEIERGRHGK